MFETSTTEVRPALQENGWRRLQFAREGLFSTTPMVLTTTQSNIDQFFCIPRIKRVGADGFDIALETMVRNVTQRRLCIHQKDWRVSVRVQKTHMAEDLQW